MKKIHKFSEKFCDEIILSLKDCKRFILQYRNETIVNDDKLNIIGNQPTNADAWRPINSSYILEIENILKTNIESIDKLEFVIQKLDINKKSDPHKDSYNYTAVLLLNNTFEGGDLIIDNTKSNLKKGELIYFSARDEHYVEKLSSGERYTLVVFIKLKNKLNKSMI
jgi:hypothetical protein